MFHFYKLWGKKVWNYMDSWVKVGNILPKYIVLCLSSICLDVPLILTSINLKRFLPLIGVSSNYAFAISLVPRLILHRLNIQFFLIIAHILFTIGIMTVCILLHLRNIIFNKNFFTVRDWWHRALSSINKTYGCFHVEYSCWYSRLGIKIFLNLQSDSLNIVSHALRNMQPQIVIFLITRKWLKPFSYDI